MSKNESIDVFSEKLLRVLWSVCCYYVVNNIICILYGYFL